MDAVLRHAQSCCSSRRSSCELTRYSALAVPIRNSQSLHFLARTKDASAVTSAPETLISAAQLSRRIPELHNSRCSIPFFLALLSLTRQWHCLELTVVCVCVCAVGRSCSAPWDPCNVLADGSFCPASWMLLYLRPSGKISLSSPFD